MKLKKVIILNIYPNTMFVHLVKLCIFTLWELFLASFLKVSPSKNQRLHCTLPHLPLPSVTKNIQNKVHRKKGRNKRDKNNNASHKKRIQNNNKNRFARFVRFTSMEFSQMETRTRKRVELGGAGGQGQGKAKGQGRIWPLWVVCCVGHGRQFTFVNHVSR